MLYRNIQGLRAVAALMVVSSHTFWSLEPLRGHWIVQLGDSIGPAGVDLFFVISGFVVFLSAGKAGERAAIVGRWQAFRGFAVRRVFRIYPIYLIAFGVATLLMTKVELAPTSLEQQPWWKLALLIDQPNNRILAAWTLQYEMIFYTMCALGILISPRRILLVLGLWFVAVFSVWITGVFTPSAPMAPLVLEFVFGIVVALLVKRGFSKYAVASLSIGIGGILLGAIVFRLYGAGWFELPQMWRVVCFGLPSAFVVYGFVAIELRSKWQFSKRWVALGDSSYSLYLWHQMLFAVMAALCVNFGLVGKVPLIALALSFLVMAIPVAMLSYHQIEKRINKSDWLTRLAGEAKRKPSVAPAAYQSSSSRSTV